MSAVIGMTPDNFVELLKSKEYLPYLYQKQNEWFVDYASLPRTHYLDINGDSIMGLSFSQKLNEAHRETKEAMIKIVPFYEMESR